MKLFSIFWKKINHITAQPTSVSITPSSLTIDVGQSMTLNCAAQGHLPSNSVTYQWFKGPSLLGSSSSYHIPNTVKENAGIYRCLATNQHGSQNGTVQVVIRCKYTIKILYLYNENIQPLVLSSLIIQYVNIQPIVLIQCKYTPF